MSDRPARQPFVTLAAVVSVLALGAGVVALTGALTADPPPRLSGRVAGTGPQGQVAQFTVECAWSHAAPDDPIVHPGAPGASHIHDFFGSTATDAYATAAHLQTTPTTCQNQRDTAAYWTPAVIVDGAAVEPLGSVAYYRPGVDVPPPSIVPYPAGLMMLAGDPGATAPQPLEIAAWRCGASPVLSATPPSCSSRAPLGVRVAFPDCWDGERLDSHDHRSHVAYSDGGTCPHGHPVPMPQLIFEVHYPIDGDAGALRLASGDPHGVHADFLNAWDQPALEREVRVCLNGDHVCGIVSNRATG